LTGEDYELKNYQVSLVKAFKIACKYGVWAGVGLGKIFIFVMKIFLIILIYCKNRFNVLHDVP